MKTVAILTPNDGQESICLLLIAYRLEKASPATAGGLNGGADRDRTGDPLLAKQVLSQLSYSPIQKPVSSC